MPEGDRLQHPQRVVEGMFCHCPTISRLSNAVVFGFRRREMIDRDGGIVDKPPSAPAYRGPEAELRAGLVSFAEQPGIKAQALNRVSPVAHIAALQDIDPPGRSDPSVVVANHAPVPPDAPDGWRPFRLASPVVDEVTSADTPHPRVSGEVALDALEPGRMGHGVVVEEADQIGSCGSESRVEGCDQARGIDRDRPLIPHRLEQRHGFIVVAAMNHDHLVGLSGLDTEPLEAAAEIVRSAPGRDDYGCAQAYYQYQWESGPVSRQGEIHYLRSDLSVDQALTESLH